ncbi:MAG: NAD-dependent epimerase/dehydratase family protein [Actinophytocola sp.]|nr:NAD-dependent epimerase/dehydratase family protein [Actinophytocola sp.]
MPDPSARSMVRERRVLVTGASGFLGTHLVRRLAVLGAETHAVSRRAAPPDPRWTAHTADLSDPDATAEVVRSVRPDVVCHLAGEVTGARGVDAVPPTLTNNVTSTVNLLHAATLTGAPRIVLAGSMEEPRPGERASSPYALSKSIAARYGELFGDLWSVPVVRLRIAMAYGPGQSDERKLIPHVVTSLLRGVEPELTSGTRQIDWVYVDDVVDAFVAAASVPDAVGTAIDIGSGVALDIHTTVELLRGLVGTDLEPRFGALPDRPLDSARIANLSTARDVLGWRPSVRLADGLNRTVTWYRERSRQQPQRVGQ